jgi:hypothetical protein
MRARWILSSVFGAVLGFAAAAGANPASYEEAKALAAKENKPLLVDFYAEW